MACDTYFRQVSDVVGVQKELFERTTVAEDVVGDVGETAVSFVDVLDLTIASAEQRNAFKHYLGSDLKTNTVSVSI